VRVGWRALLDPVHFLAFGFGAGLAPRAPGTFGTLVAVVPAWWCFALPWPVRLGVVAAVVAAGVWICGASARRLGVHDHPGIVLDEVAGLLLTALAVPEKSFFWFALAFVLFRVFDILKPWPIRDVDHRLGGGAGIMLDDLMAAVYAAACLTVSRAFLPTT
jgi:phosphatidylglycerophosphatase A